MAVRPVHLAFASDLSGAVPLGIAILSLLRVRPECIPYVFHVLDSGIPIRVQKQIQLLAVSSGCSAYFIPARGLLADLPRKGRFPTAVYHRFLLPELMPPDVQRVLYLDADVVACRDVTPLFCHDLGGRPVGAPAWQVVGPYEREMGGLLRGFCKRMGLPEDGEPYFYSSQLLMDLALMRQEKLGDRLIRFSREADPATLAWPDQDALNAVLRGRIAALPCSCNVIPLFAEAVRSGRMNPARPIVYGDEELREYYRRPMIVHYAASKPNVFRGPRDRYDELFLDLWRQSPWRRQLPYVPEGLRAFAARTPRAGACALALARAVCRFPAFLQLTRRSLSALGVGERRGTPS